MIDKVFKYENFDKEILYLEKKFKLPNFYNQIKSTKIHQITSLKSITKNDLTTEQLDIINKHANKIFKLFNYPIINKKDKSI